MIGEEYRAEIEKPARKKGVAPLQQVVALLVSLTLIWWIFKPGDGSPAPVADGAPSPRVASTSPAITDSLVELGLVAHVVGRSGFCRSVPASVPVVGDLRDFDAERLALVKPAVLFVQPPLAGADPALRAFCERKSIELVERRIDTLEDLGALLGDFERVFGPVIAPRLEAARAYIAAAPRTAADAPRVLAVVSADPFLAVGRGNYLDQMIAREGFANAVDSDGWLEMSVESIVALRPDLIVGIAETEPRAHEIESLLAILPWQGGAPEVRAVALPELLSPSLAAIAHRGALARLLHPAPEPTP